jgi:hypothetical protein
MSYQGHLLDSGGDPVTDGTYSMTFSLWDAPSDGGQLWGPEGQDVDVSDGFFAVILGRTDPISGSVLQTATYLEIVVEGETLEPRQQLASVPFALQAEEAANADTVDGRHASDLEIPAGVIVMWSGMTDTIPTGWALCDGTSGTPDLRDRFVVGAGSSYSVDDTGGSATMAHTHQVDPPNTTTSEETNWRDTGDWSSTDRIGEGRQRHRHNVDIPVLTSGPASNVENRPPYYALAYIMKLP